MKWYNPFTWGSDVEKLNPAQEDIYYESGVNASTTASINYTTAFDKLEAVNRGVNMIVNACSSLDYDIKDKKHDGNATGFRVKQIFNLLNVRPNPFQSVQEFRSNLFTDFLLEGNAFIYYDGMFIYHLPARSVTIEMDPKTFIKGFTYQSTTFFKPEDVTYFKDLSSVSIYRGTSRLVAADRNIQILYKMQTFQENFFKNGGTWTLAITTDSTMSQIAKDKTLKNWMRQYNTDIGAKKPIILDSGLKPVPIAGASTFKEMDFDTSIKAHNIKILETLGVPPVLLDGGNQANISPNLRLFYLETILPIVRKYISAMEFLTGYDIEAITSTVSALQPELKDLGSYYSTLVNNGIITPNEAREELRYEKDKDPESDKLRIPANISGSAAGGLGGGKPKQPPKDEDPKA